MKTIPRLCDYCHREYQAEPRYLARNQGIYCSRRCSGRGAAAKNTKKHEPNSICAHCSIPFYRDPSKKMSSKSGLFFCCREHKDLAQRIGGIPEIQPKHYNNGEHSKYRAKAFRYHEPKCVRCGYDKYENILEVHHKDCDRTNNEIDNLEILCPNCHTEFHFLTRTGTWRSRSEQ